MEGGRVTDTYTNTTVSIQNWCNGPSTSVNMTCMAVAHDTKLMYASCVFIYACHFPLKTVCKQPFGT
ncbi:hypothetical protein DPMN_062787 [Dreissena polymorpha]|uniref:Uncharacterized protein n=1 Tax=Dreissena polymorpha TaxID=45954 RepID=A0A9D4C9B1_DREPO|nr:hypothetical protein DPMN_062787 [Dreissena polymorpha]